MEGERLHRYLQHKAVHLNSRNLNLLAEQMEADPFGKVTDSRWLLVCDLPSDCHVGTHSFLSRFLFEKKVEGQQVAIRAGWDTFQKLNKKL